MLSADVADDDEGHEEEGDGDNNGWDNNGWGDSRLEAYKPAKYKKFKGWP